MIPLIMPVAQPTPASTDIASSGQFTAQAPHSMHASRSAITASFSSMAKTSCGQTRVHILQPEHFSG
jgi:hypothetical protein